MSENYDLLYEVPYRGFAVEIYSVLVEGSSDRRKKYAAQIQGGCYSFEDWIECQDEIWFYEWIKYEDAGDAWDGATSAIDFWLKQCDEDESGDGWFEIQQSIARMVAWDEWREQTREKEKLK